MNGELFRTLHLGEFGLLPDSGQDAVPFIQQAIETVALLEQPVVLEFAKGRYDFYPEFAAKKPYYVSNTMSEDENADVTKTIGIRLHGIKNLTLEGNGSLFMFHGKQTMFVLDQCENIEIRNVHTDFANPTMAEMTIEGIGAHYADVRVHAASHYEIVDGKLIWIGPGWRFHGGPMQVYDPISNTTWRVDNLVAKARYAEQLEPLLIRLYYESPPELVVGRVLQVRDGIRDQVGALILRSKAIRWSHVGLHYTHGLGIVCQFSEDIVLDGIRMTPRPETERTAAAFADFVQVSGCRGRITVVNSHFEGAHDDAINVHGTYLKITDRPAPNQILLRFMHGQSYGFDAFFPGDSIDYVDSSTLTAFASSIVSRADRISAREVLLTLEQEVSTTVRPGDVVENATWTPEVHIRNNYFARIPTRGILVTTRRSVRIESNLFERMQMSAILIAGDANSWYESGMVADAIIRDNRFIECGNDDNPVIYLAPENKTVHMESPVHRNIRIELNVFQVKHAGVLAAKSTIGLSFQNNTIYYPGDIEGLEDLDGHLEACSDVRIEGNLFVPKMHRSTPR